MRFPNYRRHYIYFNKAMRWAKMKKTTDKLGSMKFKEVRCEGKGAANVQF